MQFFEPTELKKRNDIQECGCHVMSHTQDSRFFVVFSNPLINIDFEINFQLKCLLLHTPFHPQWSKEIRYQHAKVSNNISVFCCKITSWLSYIGFNILWCLTNKFCCNGMVDISAIWSLLSVEWSPLCIWCLASF